VPDLVDQAQAARLGRLHRLIAGRTERVRRAALLREHAGLIDPVDVFALTDAMRWLEHMASHAARIAQYGAVAAKERPDSIEAARPAEFAD
jgi:phosphate:Na+ symporter